MSQNVQSVNGLKDIQVKMTSDNGSKFQWGKGLFYSQDGIKKTLSTKTLTVCGLTTFVVISTIIIFQGTPENQNPDQLKSNILPPEQSIQSAAVSIPPNLNSETKADNENKREKNVNKRQVFKGPQLLTRPRTVKIPPGSMLQAILLSGGSNGPVKAQAQESLIVDGETLIEEGTVFLGNGESTAERLQIYFDQIIFKDGSFETIRAQACDPNDKIAGIKGSRVGGQVVKLATGIGLSFVGGMSEGLQSSTSQGGVAIKKPTLRNALLNGVETASLEQSHEIMSEIRNKPITIEVSQGTLVFILFKGN
ncbi:MAG: TrbI/VirB10 family protein [Deltaproteobacteria bacterium]|nr:TrbI/VirB10 family protein [Deltaproteobacteria bacterium]